MKYKKNPRIMQVKHSTDLSWAIKLFSVIPGHSLGEFYPTSAEMQSVYSAAPADWANCC